MSFLHPEVFWFLFLLVIPVIIHLFFFRNKKSFYFSSLQFIKNVEQSNKSYKKLKKWIILFCRLLAFGSLIVAFTKPIQNDKLDNTYFKESINFIYIDNSFSMQCMGSRGELLSEAREIAKEYIDGLGRNSQIIIQTNQSNGIERKILNKKEALEAVNEVDYISNAKNLNQIITWQNDLLNKLQGSTNELASTRVFISDFQKINITELPDLSSKNDIVLIRTNSANTTNLTVDSVWFDIPIHKIGVSNVLNIRVQNFSSNKKDDIELSLDINGQNRNSLVSIPPNNYVIERFDIEENSDGFKNGKISINDEQLFWDDDFYFSYTVQNENSVLIINGENDSKAVLKSLTTEKSLKISEVNIKQFQSSAIESHNLIILNGLNEISSGLRSILLEFNNSGGHVLFIPGNNIETVNYNLCLKELGLSQLKFATDNSFTLEKINYDDPFFSGIFSIDKPSIRLKDIKKYYPNIPAPNSRPLLRLRNDQIILSYNKKGNFLFHFSLDPEFSSFTSDGFFNTILLRIAELSNRSLPLFCSIGENESFMLPKKEKTNSISLKNGDIQFYPTFKNKGNYSEVSLRGPEAIEKLKNGIYSISGSRNDAFLAINYNKNESVMSICSDDSLALRFKNAGTENIKFYNFSNQEEINFQPIEDSGWWRYFIILTLFFLLIEMAVLKFMK